MTAPVHDHGPDEPCEAALDLYARALRSGHAPAHEAASPPCAVHAGLLRPDHRDPDRLLPVPPAVALPRLLRAVAEDIAAHRRRETRLAEAFEPLLALAAPDGDATGTGEIHMLNGLDRINSVITRTMAGASREVLAIQPHAGHTGPPRHIHSQALDRDQAFLDRGGRIRTLYQHTTRHAPTVLARYDRLHGDVQARSLDEVTERLLVIDRSVAFIPAVKDRTLALEIRLPALVDYLGTTFDRLWRLATPMFPETVTQPTLNGVTPRQRAIAALLVEGHTDAVIADRLGMNIRTARVHIAKLAATLGSESRAQLGYLIGRSGIVEPEG